jgi:TolB protein
VVVIGMIIGRPLTPLDSSRTLRTPSRPETVCCDDNSRRKVQNVRGGSSVISQVRKDCHLKNNLPNRSIWVLTTITLLVWASTIVLAHWGAQEAPVDARARMYPSAKSGGNYMHNYYFPMAPSSTPWYPAWSPDGKRITVSMSGSIWNVDPDTGIADELAFGSKYLSSPAWSPDGTSLVYTADEDNQTIQLESLNVETGATTALTQDTFIYTDPVFSPDGTRLAYVSTKPNGFFNIFVRPIKNGRWAGDEVQITQEHRYPRNRLYFGFNDVHIEPAWTRDGMHLLVVSNRDVPLGSGHVWKIPVEADAMAKAKPVLAEQSLFRARPDISIDGKRFIYSSHRGAADQYDNLYVLPVEGGEPYKMTLFDYDAFHPRWSPDGESIAYISNEGGVPRLAVLETYGGGHRNIDIVQRRWKRPVGVVSIQTFDTGTEHLTPSRIQLTASDGKFYAPPNTYARIAQGSRDHVFHMPGSTRFEVPAGTLRVEAVKGFEYLPEQADVEIKPGEVAFVTIKLKPMTDMAALGWYSGSTHMHMNYGGNLHNTLENLMLMSAGEDQDVVNELIANKDNRVLDYQFFVPGGGAHPISKPDRLVLVGQEYRPPFYGHVILMGLRDHLLSPWSTGYEGTGIESLYPSNTDMLRKAKAQNATTDYAHSFSGDNDPLLSNDLGQAKGFIVDAALKTADGIEWAFSGRAPFFPWYAVLNNGVRVTGTGGEDSMSDLHVSKLVGSSRTYVYTGGKGLDARAWMDGLKNGHAFMSTGPLISLSVNGKMPGDDVGLPAVGGTVDVTGWVKSITPLDKAMLVANGELVEEIPLTGDRKSLEFTRRIKVARSSWLHLRVEGTPTDRHPLDTGFAQAFTSPVWVSVGSQPVRNLAAAEYCIKWIDKLQVLAAADPGWRSQKERDHVFAQFEEARQIYRRFAQEAAQMKPTTAQAVELIPAPAERDQSDPVSALELVGLCSLVGLALVGRAHRWGATIRRPAA